MRSSESGAAADEAEDFAENESCGNQGGKTGDDGIVRPDGFQDGARVSSSASPKTKMSN